MPTAATTRPRTRRRRSRGYREPILQRWLFSRRILIVLGVLVVAGLVWWMTEGQYFPVPTVAGMTVSTARADLTNVGLVAVSGTARHSDTVPAGEVITTSPAAGAQDQARRQDHPHSLARPGGGRRAVCHGRAARAGRSGAEGGRADPRPADLQPSSSIPQGIVIATNPVAYQHWPKDKPVHLVVSAGPPLPNFVGQQLGVAQAAAQLAVTASTRSPWPRARSRRAPSSGSPRGQHADHPRRGRDGVGICWPAAGERPRRHRRGHPSGGGRPDVRPDST